jgi:hypothetical protein
MGREQQMPTPIRVNVMSNRLPLSKAGQRRSTLRPGRPAGRRAFGAAARAHHRLCVVVGVRVRFEPIGVARPPRDRMM